MRMKYCVISICILLIVVSISACSSLSYYGQAIAGQWQVLQARKDITAILVASDTSEALSVQLKQAQVIRRYASEQLGLPDNDSYTQYADVKRPYVVWNVVAALPYSLSPLRHCFPFAGCVVYRGFFKQPLAQAYVDSLQEQGYDTYLYGVRAYSTLGWFDDPLLNTMLNTEDELYLASMVFHELTHQVVYVKGASEFNESFATAIEQLSLQQWLTEQGREDLLQLHEQRQIKQRQFLDLVLQYREKLVELYKQAAPRETDKQEVFSDLLRGYSELKKQQWQGYAGYDLWFSRQLNNAKLAVLSAYSEQVEMVKMHYVSCGLPMSAYLQWLAEVDLGTEARREDFFANTSECGGNIGTLS